MDTGIRVCAVGLPQLDHLVRMYDGFDPLGGALGLPPVPAEARRDWIVSALSRQLNVAAFSASGGVVGHCFLVPDEPASAEMAVFVRQEFREKGVGTALVKAALALGAGAELRRVWSLTSWDNQAALRLQARCGFRLRDNPCPETILEIDLPVSQAGICDAPLLAACAPVHLAGKAA